jgi:hypothetical protein
MRRLRRDGTNLRAVGLNPRALGTNPKAIRANGQLAVAYKRRKRAATLSYLREWALWKEAIEAWGRD